MEKDSRVASRGDHRAEPTLELGSYRRRVSVVALMHCVRLMTCGCRETGVFHVFQLWHKECLRETRMTQHVAQFHGEESMFVRLFAIPATFFAIAVFAAVSSAQYPVYPIGGGFDRISDCPSARRTSDRYGSYRPDLYDDHYVAHRPDVYKLDRWADKLAEAAKHLHEDAHELGQDYEHSAGIEAYVARLDRLNEHMHEILHYAAERHYLSNSSLRHVANDVQQVRQLAIRLDGELQHQRYDGARTRDFHALDHMRQIIAREIIPLVRSMEYEMDYRSLSHHDSIHSHEIHHVSRFGH